MSSVLNFLPHLLTKCSSDGFVGFFSHFCGVRVVGEGAEHNNLRAKILFLALVSNSNATVSSLLREDPNWISD